MEVLVTFVAQGNTILQHHSHSALEQDRRSTLPSPSAIAGLKPAQIHLREVLEELVESLEAERGELEAGQVFWRCPTAKPAPSMIPFKAHLRD